MKVLFYQDIYIIYVENKYGGSLANYKLFSNMKIKKAYFL